MNELVIEAFSDELVKIAFFQKARAGIMGALKEGWHGTPGNEATWFGRGRELRPGMGRGAKMMEEATSLGGATKALPIGGKSMMLLGTGLMAQQAMRPVDPSGQNRSRTERMTGLAGNTVGGLLGSAVGNRIRPGLLGSAVGGIMGAGLAEKTVTAPFAALRGHRMGMQQQQLPQAPQQPAPYQGAPA
jgi:hypothetical protein